MFSRASTGSWLWACPNIFWSCNNSVTVTKLQWILVIQWYCECFNCSVICENRRLAIISQIRLGKSSGHTFFFIFTELQLNKLKWNPVILCHTLVHQPLNPMTSNFSSYYDCYVNGGLSISRFQQWVIHFITFIDNFLVFLFDTWLIRISCSSVYLRKDDSFLIRIMY